MPAYCYFILCDNNAFYTGWTKNIKRRFKQHLHGKGAYYTKVHSPVEVVYWESYGDDKIARKREVQLKKLTHNQKINLSRGRLTNMCDRLYFDKYNYFVNSPGRVNLLGEHVDYNGGPVLPVAIDRSVSLWANRRNDQQFSVNSLDMDQNVVLTLNSIESRMDIQGNPLPDWALYPAGVIHIAHKQNYQINGFDSLFKSNIPIGSGLSSSAAIEIAFAALLREFGMWKMDNLQLALLSQEAEQRYVGVNCGIMDQFASANGAANSALYLDTATLQWQILPLPKDVAIVIADSKIKRNLATSEYNERRASCEEALSKLKEFSPSINYLSDVSPQEFAKFGKNLAEIPYKRAKHVIEECQRVKLAAQALKSSNIVEFGKLMKATHASLRDLYEVSIPQIDTLVEIANAHRSCFGSRLTGAGFGGCTVSLVLQESADKFMDDIKRDYYLNTGSEIEVYICKASNGVTVQWRNQTSSLTDGKSPID